MARNKNLRISAKRKFVTIRLPVWVANSTKVIMLMAIPEHPKASGQNRVRIMGIAVASATVPVDADGTMLINVKAYDKSEAGADTLVSGFNAEALVANTASDLTFAAETSEVERTLAAGDALYAELVNNSVGIDTNWADGDAVITVEFETVDVPGEGFGNEL